jgi:hypothetical protein
MNSPASCRARTYGTLYCLSRRGLIRMSLCRMKPWQARWRSGKSARAMASNRGLSLGLTQYHTLGAPKCR